MRNVGSLIIVLLLFPSIASAQLADRKVVETIMSSDSVEEMTIRSTATIWTKSIRLVNSSAETIAVRYQMLSNNGSLKIELEQGVNSPSTEYVYDSGYITTDTVVEALTTSTPRLYTLDTVSLPYFRFKVSGTGTNSTATKLKMKVYK